MKKAVVILGAAVVLAVIYVIGFGQAKQPKAKKATFASAEQLTYKELAPGASMATVWGDADKGRFGAFVKFVPNFNAGMHTHTNENWIVVIKGAYLYRDDDGEKRVGSGDYIRVPGGHKHWSGGDSTEGALFYTEAAGKFDLIPAK